MPPNSISYFDLLTNEREIIHGSLLGDGTIKKPYKEGALCSYSEVHGNNQEEWLFWKKQKLGRMKSTFKPFFKPKKKQDNGKVVCCDGHLINHMLNTSRYSAFSYLERKWYKRDEDGNYIFKNVGKRQCRIKIVPLDLLLTPLSTSVWYIDDGYNCTSNRVCVLSTQCFTLDENEFLRDRLINMGFSCAVSPYCGKYILRINRSSYGDFLTMVRNELADAPDCIKYKIDPMYKSIPKSESVRNKIRTGHINRNPYYYVVTSPSGEVFKNVLSINEFSKHHFHKSGAASQASFSSVLCLIARGKSSSFKGWTCQRFKKIK